MVDCFWEIVEVVIRVVVVESWVDGRALANGDSK
jgi:hypothetical protein